VPRIVEKAEALELLEQNRRKLLGDEGGCTMCALVRHAPASDDLLAESEHGVALLDRFGGSPGHALVIAREHREEATELGWPAYSGLQRLAYEASLAQRRALEPARIFVAVLGASTPLPMSFPHFHIHVLPVYGNDERSRPAHVFSWSAGVVLYTDAEAGELTRRLKAAWPARDGSELPRRSGSSRT
jgi:diadenosine tetraphosphate (Ap4A) HIT family hydrolase